MKRYVRTFLLLLMTLMTLGLAGCASFIYTSNYDSYITQQMKTYRYSTSEFDRVWTVARQLLFKQGFQVRDSGNGYNVETEWGDTCNGLRRYLLTGYTNTAGEAWIEFLYYEQTYENHGVNASSNSGRDYQMEAEVLRQVSPNEWTRISNEADAYAKSKASN